jgi:general secretion pathway protein I
MGGASMGGMQSIVPLLMSLVYPSLKPMLEASIRRVTVTVKWREGSVARDLSATQFVTLPQQGGFDPLAAEGLDEAADQALDLIDQLGGAAAGVPKPAGDRGGEK